jgi:hypothetical protein
MEKRLIARGVQANIGMGFGVLAFGVAIGALLAVVFVVAHGRIGSIRPRTTAVLIVVAGFAAASVVPLVKYPPNPPAVGHAETIRERTGLYLLMVGLSIVLAIGAIWLGRRLAALGTQLVLWTTIAVVFARLAGRLLDRTPSAGVLRRTYAPNGEPADRSFHLAVFRD